MKRLMSIGAIAALTTGLFADIAAAAQPAPTPPSPEQVATSAIQTRQGLFKLIGYNFGPIGGALRNRQPLDATLVARNSPRIEMLAAMIPELLRNDTRQFHSAVKTAALDVVWTGQADLNAKANDLVKAAAALTAAARSGDQDAIQAAAGGVAKACGSCHDTYRAR